MSTPNLKIENLRVSIEDKEIIKGLNLEINGGEIHAIMGPNGTGKSTLSSALMGHPKYEVTEGNVTFDGKDLLRWKLMNVQSRTFPCNAIPK